MGKEIKFTDTATDETIEGSSSTKLGEKAWYIISARNTYENRVAEDLRRRVETLDLKNLIFDILVAEYEEVVYDKEGNKTDKVRKKNFYPGYIYVQMIMTDYAWYVIRNTPNVTGFVGSSGKGTKPFPVPREEMESVLKRIGKIEDTMYNRYQPGDMVKVINGGFTGTEGKILSINKDNGTVMVEARYFGNVTNIEVEFKDIDKI